MAINPNMANREVANLVLLNYTTKAPFLNLDFANVTTTDLTATRVMATGGQGAPDRVAFDGQRKGTIKIDTQITPMKLYAMLAGVDVTTTAKYIARETLVSATKVITLSDTPVTGSVYVYAENDDCGTAEDITVTDKTVTLTTAADGTYIVYYLIEKTTGSQTVKFNAKTFPKAFTIYGETPWKTEDDEIVAMKLTYFKAQPQSTFTLAFQNTGDPTTVSITCDLMADENNDIYDMSIIG